MFIFHIGIISSWGRGGEMDLFDGQNQPKFYRFWSILIWKIFRFKKSLFSWLTYTLCHNYAQKVLFPSLKPRESGRILYFRSKSPFFDLNHKRLCRSPTFDLRAKFYMVSCTPWLVVLILQPNSKSTPKSYSAIRPILTSNTLNVSVFLSKADFHLHF